LQRLTENQHLIAKPETEVLLADQFRKFFAWETPSDCQWQATDFSEADLN